MSHLDKRLDALIAEGLIHPDSSAPGFARRLLRHRERLFVFLTYPGAEATNNRAEGALRAPRGG